MRMLSTGIEIAAVVIETAWLGILATFYLMFGCPTCTEAGAYIFLGLFPLWILVEIPLAIIGFIAGCHLLWRFTARWRRWLTRTSLWRWFWNEG